MISAYFSHNPLIFVGDPSWTRQNETDDGSIYKLLKKLYVTDKPGSGNVVKPSETNDPVKRINALDEPFRNMWPDGEPGVIYDRRCALLIEGLRSKYRYVRVKGAEGRYKDSPDKGHRCSHVVDADQYGTMFILSKRYNAAEYVRSTYDPATRRTTHQRTGDSYVGY